MKSIPTLEDRQKFLPSASLELSEDSIKLRNPRKAALLSLIPGLGQIYNGEVGKGQLFLAVSAVNVLLLLVMVFSQPILSTAAQLAAQFNLQFNLEVVKSPELATAFRVVAALYMGLLVSFVIYAMRDAYDHALQSRQGMVYAKYFLGLAEATSGSYLFHFLVTAFCFSMVFFVAIAKAPVETVVQIELPAPEPPPPPPPPPVRHVRNETPKPDTPKPKEPKPEVKPEPPKPTQVAVAVPTNEPTPYVQGPVEAPAQEPAPAPVPAGPSGGGSGAPSGSGESTEIDYSDYLTHMQRRIKKAWFPPKGNESKRVSVKFKLNRSGEVSRIRLLESSGLTVVDDAATTAIEQAAPFGPLPAGSPEQIEIKFTFDYNVFNGGQAELRK